MHPSKTLRILVVLKTAQKILKTGLTEEPSARDAKKRKAN